MIDTLFIFLGLFIVGVGILGGAGYWLYKKLDKTATVTIYKVRGGNSIVRVRVGFQLPRFSRTSMGSSTFLLGRAANFHSECATDTAVDNTLAQRGCLESWAVKRVIKS